MFPKALILASKCCSLHLFGNYLAFWPPLCSQAKCQPKWTSWASKVSPKTVSTTMLLRTSGVGGLKPPYHHWSHGAPQRILPWLLQKESLEVEDELSAPWNFHTRSSVVGKLQWIPLKERSSSLISRLQIDCGTGLCRLNEEYSTWSPFHYRLSLHSTPGHS